MMGRHMILQCLSDSESVCLSACVSVSSLSELSDPSHHGADHHDHDHSGDIMIMGALGGPARTRGSPAQGRRGGLRAPGVLRRAHSMFLQGPPPARPRPVGFCQCQPVRVTVCLSVCQHRICYLCACLYVRRRHTTPRHIWNPHHLTKIHQQIELRLYAIISLK
jgi:hypothetical protein